MLHITFSKYDCKIVHKAYYLFTCTCVSINSFHSHSHSHILPSKNIYCTCSYRYRNDNVIKIDSHLTH